MADQGKIKARSEALRKNIYISTIEARRRFALLALLRSAVFSEIYVDNRLVTLPAGANLLFFDR